MGDEQNFYLQAALKAEQASPPATQQKKRTLLHIPPCGTTGAKRPAGMNSSSIRTPIINTT